MRLTIDLDREQEERLAALDERSRAALQSRVSTLVRSYVEGTEEPAIRSTPDVMGGDDCIRKTRIPVWLLVAYKSDGAQDDEILRNYPGLTSEDLAAACAFYAAHPHRVAEQRRRHEEAD